MGSDSSAASTTSPELAISGLEDRTMMSTWMSPVGSKQTCIDTTTLGPQSARMTGWRTGPVGDSVGETPSLLELERKPLPETTPPRS